MFARRPSASSARLPGLAALVAVNLAPLVGVAALGWNLSALLALYWVESAATALMAALKALFAERAPDDAATRLQPLRELCEKRGGLRLRAGWPPVYLRNVPFALGVLGVSTAMLVGYGVLLAVQLGVRPAAVLSSGFLAGAGGFVLARLVEFRVEYIGRGEYADVSARAVAATPARHLLLLAVLAPLAGAGAGAADGATLLVGVVAAKTATECYGFHLDHSDRSPGRLGRWLRGPQDASEPPPEVDAPDAEPDVRMRPDARAVLLGASAPVAAALASRPGYLAAFTLAVGALALGPGVVAAAAGLLVLVAAAKAGSHYLRYGTLEYQRRGDRLVAYDALLDEPQWTAAVGGVAEASVENRVVDRLLGTGTLTLFGLDSAGRSTVRLGPVDDVDRAVEAFELPVADTSRPAANRAAVAAALGLAACFLAVPAGLFVAPGVQTGTAVGVSLLLGPFFLLLVGVLLAGGLSRV